jgi:hypothetical protein
MLRRAAIASFAVAALLVVACGHQVTPSPTAANNDLSGRLVVKFQVNGTLDFTNYTYAIIIDTCGNGTPYPQAYQTTFNSFSYGFFIGGKFGAALPELIEYFVNPNSNGQIQYVAVPENSSLEQFTPNYNSQSNEFELIFSRAELDNPLNQAQPCPNITAAPATPVPSDSAGASPTASPTPTPTASSTSSTSPSASPTPSPTAAVTTTPLAFATTSAQQYWYINFFTIQGNTILDSLGIGGPNDTTFNGVGLNTNVTQDYPIFKATGGVEPSNPSAQLTGGDITNYE